MRTPFCYSIEPLESRIAPAFAALIELASLNGVNGLKIGGEEAGDALGVSVGKAGDVNGDGFDDLIVGAPGADPNDNDSSGGTYVVFGKAGGFSAAFDLGGLNGDNGFRLNGAAEGDYSGFSVTGAGDVNGDGFDDLLIGAYGADHGEAYASGSTYVVFGKARGFSAEVDLSALGGSDGFTLHGEAGYDYSGLAVGAAGDVNGDGFDDLLIGAPRATANDNAYSGASYVVFGRSRGFADTVNLANLNGTNGFQINGEGAGDYSGAAVSAAGDVNGDGFDDLLIGASSTYYNGAAYVVFGKARAFSRALDLTTLNGMNGFKIAGELAEDYVGATVSSAGDVNGDGFADILIGGYLVDTSGVIDSGASYVVFGKSGRFAASLDLATLNGADGFRIDGEFADDSLGKSVSAAGDVNGDGFDDLILGAPGSDPNGDLSGAAYVIFGKGSAFTPTLDLAGLDGLSGFRMSGAAAGDRFGESVREAGDVNGDGFNDMIIGAPQASFDADANGAAYIVFGRSPNPNISVNDAAVAEGIAGTTFLSFLVSLDGPAALPVTVSFATVDGSATAGSDYLAQELSQLTFAPGEISKTITVNVSGDTEVEPYETVAVHLTAAINASIFRGTGAGTILNDDAALRISDTAALEGDSGTSALTFSVSLDQPTVLPVKVSFASVSGTAIADSDYTAIALDSLNFAPGELARHVTVLISGDIENESDETLELVLSGAVNASIADAVGHGTIRNDETLIRISDATFAEGNSGTQPLTFSVDLTAAHQQSVTVDFMIVDGTAAAGSDFAAPISGTLTFAAGETIQTVTAAINGDLLAEPTETFSVLLSNSRNAAILDEIGVGAILNDDGSLRVEDSSLIEGHTGNRRLTFAVTLAASSVLPVSVSFASENGTATPGIDYAPFDTGTLIFAPGETSKTIAVEVLGDTIVDPNETVSVELSNASNALIEDAAAVATILDDDVTLRGKRTATFTDVDGELATIKVSAGTLKVEDFTIVPSGLGAQMALVDFSGEAEFERTDLKIAVKRGDQAAGADRMVHVGYINAAGINLGAVRIRGDLGQIDSGNGPASFPAISALSAHSLGHSGLATQLEGGSLQSDIAGGLNLLTLRAGIENAVLSVSGDLERVAIAGAILGGVIQTDGRIGVVKIGGDLAASASNPAMITARGILAPLSTTAALAIGAIEVGGSVEGAKILAGYDRTGEAVNGDARLGKVWIGLDWIASDLVAGAVAGGDGQFGTEDDALIPNGTSIVARIASIVVKRTADGDRGETDQFGFVAEQIAAFIAGGTKLELQRGARNDLEGSSVGNGDQVWVREVA